MVRNNSETAMVTKYSVRYVLLFPWCGPDPKDTRSARCMSCNKSFKIDTMGKAAFISHEKSKGHQMIIKMQSSNTLMTHYVDSKEAPKTDDSTQNLCSINSTIVEPSERDPTICLNSIIPDTVCTPSRSAGATMKKYVLKEAVTKAKILWCFHTLQRTVQPVALEHWLLYLNQCFQTVILRQALSLGDLKLVT
ncbi:uncharacterized protein LOC129728548 [Wyeomyia smithii]|uniref:uncharacterized protein LOC129728548 n=1 Tax=Wyeomyia smithii TaxID=174621 RepID=UPI0024680ED0|nr:uncharacterized protein LOC129728548 [Wyeomyia smithii]